jgi:hypothetical protein
MGEKRNQYKILVGKSEWKRPLERPRRRLEDNIKLDAKEIGVGWWLWTGLIWLRFGTVFGLF